MKKTRDPNDDRPTEDPDYEPEDSKRTTRSESLLRREIQPAEKKKITKGKKGYPYQSQLDACTSKFFPTNEFKKKFQENPEKVVLGIVQKILKGTGEKQHEPGPGKKIQKMRKLDKERETENMRPRLNAEKYRIKMNREDKPQATKLSIKHQKKKKRIIKKTTSPSQELKDRLEPAVNFPFNFSPKLPFTNPPNPVERLPKKEKWRKKYYANRGMPEAWNDPQGIPISQQKRMFADDRFTLPFLTKIEKPVKPPKENGGDSEVIPLPLPTDDSEITPSSNIVQQEINVDPLHFLQEDSSSYQRRDSWRDIQVGVPDVYLQNYRAPNPNPLFTQRPTGFSALPTVAVGDYIKGNDVDEQDNELNGKKNGNEDPIFGRSNLD